MAAAELNPEPLTSDLPADGRTLPGIELLLVLGVSLGQSAVYSILSILEKATRGTPLNQQTTSINSSVVPDRPWLDLSYQVAGVVFPLVPALLALYLLQRSADRTRIGFDLRRPGFDLSRGFGLAAVIGIPGLALYFVARAFGLNTNVAPANLAANWWTVPVLIALAAMNAILEEVVMIGFWFVRATQLKWAPWVVLLSSAVVRGSYHLYQGYGGFVGNIVMGIVFGLAYWRFKRVGPLVVAHFLLDFFAFVGYSLIAPYVSWL
ncbi:MAG TPA: type II CAAX endopeptidase family protein [Propionicimonas sp.]|nr:type II CAAX endopeptidase family protein [Propionicimonas sp.]HQA76987.1 type II CAAX endopeptidase family protein [Propionicimonas sp.]HQD97092.1 type II CAAX endopeptidase family protein [Propionicimonas sp.]